MIFAIQIFDAEQDVPEASRRRFRTRNHLNRSSYWTQAAATATAFRDVFIASLAKGAVAARQMVVPIAAVQVLMVSVLLGFFYWEPMRSAFQAIVTVKAHMGVVFAFLSMGLIAVFAEVLKRVTSPGSRESLLGTSAYGFLVFGVLGVLTDRFYIVQTALWGWLPAGFQIPAKVLTDQFLYTVLLANPYQTLLYVLKDCGFHPGIFWSRIRPFRDFYVREMLAVLVTNWAFWIPTTAILYALPTDLQFVICQLAIVIWILLLTALTKKG